LISEGTTLVRLDGVRVRIGRKREVVFPDVALASGESVAIIGENGSGKSTFCRLIAGLQSASSGKVSRKSGFGSLTIGFLPQVGGLYQDLTVQENLDLTRRLARSSTLFDPRLFPDLWRLGLESLLETRVSRLSGGYKRLTAIASILTAEPDILVMDEPLAGLDEDKRDVVANLLAAIKGHELVVVTAHRSADAAFCSRTITLSGNSP
jgi:ABC-type multidrug transport system ATPase subunit